MVTSHGNIDGNLDANFSFFKTFYEFFSSVIGRCCGIILHLRQKMHVMPFNETIWI
jgi:hypothetical protein